MNEELEAAFISLEKHFGTNGVNEEEYKKVIDELPGDTLRGLRECFDLIDTDGTGKVPWNDLYQYIIHIAVSSDQQLGVARRYSEPQKSITFPRNVDSRRSFYCPGLGLVSCLRAEKSGSGYLGTVIMEPVTWQPLAHVAERNICSASFSLRHRVLGICDECEIRLSFYSTNKVIPAKADIFDDGVGLPRPFVHPAIRQKRYILEGQCQTVTETYPLLGTIYTKTRHLHIISGKGNLNSTFITADRTGRVYLWDSTRIDVLRSNPFSVGISSNLLLFNKRIHSDMIGSILCTTENIISSTPGGHIAVLDPLSECVVQEIKSTIDATDYELTSISTLGWSAHYKLIIAGGVTGDISLWAYAGQKSERQQRLILRDSERRHFRCIKGIETIPDNPHHIVSSDSMGLVKIWDLRRLQCIQTLHHTSSIDAAHSKDAKQVLNSITILPKGGILALGQPTCLYEPCKAMGLGAATPDQVIGIAIQLCTLSLWSWSSHSIQRWSLVSTMMVAQYHFPEISILHVIPPIKETPRWVIVSHKVGIVILNRDHGLQLASHSMSTPPMLISIKKIRDSVFSLTCYSGSKDRDAQIITLEYRCERLETNSSVKKNEKEIIERDLEEIMLSCNDPIEVVRKEFVSEGPVLVCTSSRVVSGCGGFIGWFPVTELFTTYLNSDQSHVKGIALYKSGYQVMTSDCVKTTVDGLSEFCEPIPESTSSPQRSNFKTTPDRRTSSIHQNKAVNCAKSRDYPQIVTCVELHETGVIVLADTFGGLTIWLLNPPFQKVGTLENLSVGHQTTSLSYYKSRMKLYVGDDFGCITSYAMVEIFNVSSSIKRVPVHVVADTSDWHTLPVQQLRIEISSLLISTAGREIFLWSDSLTKLTALSSQRSELPLGYELPFHVEETEPEDLSKYLKVVIPQRMTHVNKIGYLYISEICEEKDIEDLVFTETANSTHESPYRSLSHFWNQSRLSTTEQMRSSSIAPPAWTKLNNSVGELSLDSSSSETYVFKPSRHNDRNRSENDIVEGISDNNFNKFNKINENTSCEPSNSKEVGFESENENIYKDESDYCISLKSWKPDINNNDTDDHQPTIIKSALKKTAQDNQKEHELDFLKSWTPKDDALFDFQQNDINKQTDDCVKLLLDENISEDQFKSSDISNTESEPTPDDDYYDDDNFDLQNVSNESISSKSFIMSSEKGYLLFRGYLSLVGITFPLHNIKLTLRILQYLSSETPSFPNKMTLRHVLWKPATVAADITKLYLFGILKNKSLKTNTVVAVMNYVDVTCTPPYRMKRKEVWVLIRKLFTILDSFLILQFYKGDASDEIFSRYSRCRLQDTNKRSSSTVSSLRSDQSNKIKINRESIARALTEVQFMESFQVVKESLNSVNASPYGEGLDGSEINKSILSKPQHRGKRDKKKVRVSTKVQSVVLDDKNDLVTTAVVESSRSVVFSKKKKVRLNSSQLPHGCIMTDGFLTGRIGKLRKEKGKRITSPTRGLLPSDAHFDSQVCFSVPTGDDQDSDTNHDHQSDTCRISSPSNEIRKPSSDYRKCSLFADEDESDLSTTETRFGNHEFGVAQHHTRDFNKRGSSKTRPIQTPRVRLRAEATVFHQRVSQAESISKNRILVKMWITIRVICDTPDACRIFSYLTGIEMTLNKLGKSPKKVVFKKSANSVGGKIQRPWWRSHQKNNQVTSAGDEELISSVKTDASDPRAKVVFRRFASENPIPVPPSKSAVRRSARQVCSKPIQTVLQRHQPGWIALPDTPIGLISIPHQIRQSPSREWDRLLQNGVLNLK